MFMHHNPDAFKLQNAASNNTNIIKTTPGGEEVIKLDDVITNEDLTPDGLDNEVPDVTPGNEIKLEVTDDMQLDVYNAEPADDDTVLYNNDETTDSVENSVEIIHCFKSYASTFWSTKHQSNVNINSIHEINPKLQSMKEKYHCSDEQFQILCNAVAYKMNDHTEYVYDNPANYPQNEPTAHQQRIWKEQIQANKNIVYPPGLKLCCDDISTNTINYKDTIIKLNRYQSKLNHVLNNDDFIRHKLEMQAAHYVNAVQSQNNIYPKYYPKLMNEIIDVVKNTFDKYDSNYNKSHFFPNIQIPKVLSQHEIATMSKGLRGGMPKRDADSKKSRRTKKKGKKKQKEHDLESDSDEPSGTESSQPKSKPPKSPKPSRSSIIYIYIYTYQHSHNRIIEIHCII